MEKSVLNIAVVLLSDAVVGGVQRRMFALARLLREKKGHRFTFVMAGNVKQSLRNAPRFVDQAAFDWIALTTPFKPQDRFPAYIPRLLQRASLFLQAMVNWIFWSIQLAFVLRKLKPDVVNIAIETSVLAYWPLSYGSRIPVLFSVVGNEVRLLDQHSRGGINARLLAHAVRRLLRCARQVDVLGPDLLDVIRRVPGVDLSRCHFRRSFVETDHFLPSQEKKPWVVFAHRFFDEKNPMLFIEAIPFIKTRHPEARFFILGHGDLEEQIRLRVNALGLSDVVTVELNDRLETVLSKSMIFLCLQRNENYPSRSMLEAMSSGNAVVATDIGYTHLLVNEDTGLRVPPDAGKIAEAVNTLLDDPKRTMVLGRQARALMIRDFDLQAYMEGLDQLYRAVARSAESRESRPGSAGPP